MNKSVLDSEFKFKSQVILSLLPEAPSTNGCVTRCCVWKHRSSHLDDSSLLGPLKSSTNPFSVVVAKNIYNLWQTVVEVVKMLTCVWECVWNLWWKQFHLRWSHKLATSVASSVFFCFAYERDHFPKWSWFWQKREESQHLFGLIQVTDWVEINQVN